MAPFIPLLLPPARAKSLNVAEIGAFSNCRIGIFDIGYYNDSCVFFD